MKNYAYYIGIDVSKMTLDFCLIDASSAETLLQGKIDNTKKGITSLIRKMAAKKVSTSETFFCFENTGVYSVPLSIFLSEKGEDYMEVAALEIKKSKGITRGKTDKTDARDIALYSLRNKDKLKLSIIPSKEIMTLKVLVSERKKTIKSIKSFSMGKENIGFLPDEVCNKWKEGNSQIVKQLKDYKAYLERQIEEVVRNCDYLNNQKKLLMSVPGIGKTIATYIIIATKGFTCFTNARQFACYVGVAPFAYSSGTSIKGKTKVSHLADKNLKALLYMGALNAIKYDPELKAYYERKMKEGKHFMLVMNNIKCKLIGRAFAVINRNSEFINIKKFAA